MPLIVCLGNPGPEYAHTRHNIGFMVGDHLAAKHGVAWTKPSSLYMEAVIRIARKPVVLIKPLTYMNLSGQAVKKAMGVHHLLPKDVVIVVDEYNFPLGKIHLKPGGSDGGHNGTASVMHELATPNFWRLRCGIDRHFGPGELVKYVLAPFTPEESIARDGMIKMASEAVEEIAKHGAQTAMQNINRRMGE
ncbi:MAG: aminoacyl-tRNA hydrolase [Ignavibacteriae bacterium]|nr:MAG: aminoacyl-tRNA hydrolase [Ignavibacteriota bacterium]